jgi:hypothetical protein
VVIPATALTAAVPMAENQILSFEPAARLRQRRQPKYQQFDHSQLARE